MIHNRYLLLILLLLPAVIGNNRITAQISEGGIPPSFNYPEIKTRKNNRSSFHIPPNFDVEAQIDADRKEQEEMGGTTPLHIGKLIPVNQTYGGINLWRDGEKIILPDGTLIYRLAIKSPGALAIGLYYDRFFLPPGGKLFIYNPTKGALIGAFNDRNNVPEGSGFATELVAGDETILEYVVPGKTAGNETFRKTDVPNINITSIGYGYNHIYDTQNDGQIGNSDNCMVNINCSPEGDKWQDQKKGVAKITFPSGSHPLGSGYISVCSGSIVNNTAQDLTPYFLTAFHCVDDIIDDSVRFGQMIFYFHFENRDCENINTYPSSKTMTGAEYVAGSSIYDGNGSDGALLKLIKDIPNTYGVYYNGWDRTNTAVFDGVSIHHPSGDLKKISTFVGAQSHAQKLKWVGGGQTPAGAHWQVPFQPTTNGSGGAEAGSSGSPLFNSRGLITGTLSGGSQACAPSSAYYGKLWYHWDQGSSQPLAPYLDPLNTGNNTLDGTYTAIPKDASFDANTEKIYVFNTVTYTCHSSENVTFHWQFEGGTPSEFEGKIPPEITYNTPGIFTTTLSVNKGKHNEGVSTRKITVLEKGNNPQAPTASFTIMKLLLEENFSGSFPPTGWTTEKRTESLETWRRNYDVYAYNSPDPISPTSVAYQRYDTESAIDSWLISPAIAIPANGVTTVRFYCLGQQIYFYVIDGTDEIELWNQTADTANSWTYPEIDLSGYAGKSIKLAWRYIAPHTGTGSGVGEIDGVVVGAGVPDTKVTINRGDYIMPKDNSTGPPILYNWTFDGGSPAASEKELPNPIQYTTSGEQHVTLKVKNYRGENTRTLTNAVTVVEQPPVAAFEVNGAYTRRKDFGLFVPRGAEVSFTDKSEKYPTSWEWRFGGGVNPNTVTEQHPTVKFDAEGEFDIALKAGNVAGVGEINIENGIKVGGRDTVWNLLPGESPDGLYASFYGYTTGTNSDQHTAYAELFDAPWMKAVIITAIKVNLTVNGANSSHRLPIIIAKKGADGYPDKELSRTIFKPLNVNPDGATLIELDVPVIVDGPFFVVIGDAMGYDGNFYNPGYTAAIASSLERGPNAKCTTYLFDNYWHTWYRFDKYSYPNLSLDVEPVIGYAQYDGIDTEELTFPNIDNSAATVHVKTNLPWSAVSDAPWIVITDGSREGDGAFTVRAIDNPYDARRATITVSAGEDFKNYIRVRQAGPAPTDLTMSVADDKTTDRILRWIAPTVLDVNSLYAGETRADLSYTVYRNGQPIGSTTTTNYFDNDAPTGACYEVTAVYDHEIESMPSNKICEKLPLTITAEDATREYGDVNPVFELRYDGFADHDTEADLDMPPVASTTADETSPVGSYTIMLSGGMDARYDFTRINGTLEITAKEQTIDFPEIPVQSILDGSYTPNATVSSGLPVKYTITDETVAAFDADGKTLLFKTTGETDITAYVESYPNHTEATPVTRTLKVAEVLDQTIDFPEIPEQSVIDGSYTLNATASSGLPVKYTIVDETVATLDADGKTLLFQKVGETDITAGVESNPKYAEAAPVTRTLRVTEVRDQTIDFPEIPEQSIIDGSYTLNATASSGLPVKYTIADGTIAALDTDGTTLLFNKFGDTKVTASVEQDPNCKPVTRPLKITGLEQTIDFPEIPTLYIDDQSYTLNATASSGSPVRYTIVGAEIAEIDADGKTLRFKKIGNAKVMASIGANTHYMRADPVIRTLKINGGSDSDYPTDETGIKVYPNPIGAGRQINIAVDLSAEISADAVIEIYNTAGAMIQKETMVTNNNSITMPNIAGNYIIQFISGDYEKAIKVLVVNE